MTAIKILVIEDMVNTISGGVELAALSEFDDNMIFDFKRKSQDIDYKNIFDYALIFVDIELEKNSNEDGFAIIRKIHNIYHYPLKQILILTGNTVIEEKLKENDIDPSIVIIKKPINYIDIAKELKKRIILSTEGTYSLI